MLRILIFTSIATICTAVQGCIAEKKPLENSVDLQDSGIRLSAEGGKVYIYPERLYFANNSWFFINDQLQLVPIKALLKDNDGYHIRTGEEIDDQRCRLGHKGFVQKGETWYCMAIDCPYSVEKNLK